MYRFMENEGTDTIPQFDPEAIAAGRALIHMQMSCTKLFKKP